MPIWERYDTTNTLGAVGDHGNTELLHNQQADENFESIDLVFVDGIVTIITNTDDLIGVRLLILDEQILTANINEDDPEPHNPAVWYTWFAARGPMVFRLRSKKTLPPEHKLWLNVWKARGTTASTVNAGFLLYEAAKH